MCVRGWGGSYHPVSFKSLIVALISTIPPGMWYCLWFISSIGRGSSGFHSALVTIKLSDVREQMWKFCQLLKMCIPIINFKTGEINTVHLGTHWNHCETNVNQNPVGHLISISCYSDHWTTVMFWVFWINVISQLVSNNYYFLFPSA